MPLKVKITFTGICSILRNDDRILLPYANRSRYSCDIPIIIPAHHAYIRYQVDQNAAGVPPDEYSPDGMLAAIFLNGDEIGLTGTLAAPNIKQTDPIDFVASMERIYPGLQLDQAVLKEPQYLSHAQVAAYFPLNMGRFLTPAPNEARKWHFFPQRADPVRLTLAQEVTYQIQLLQDYIGISLKPFGANNSTEVLRLSPSDGTGSVTIVIGNTRHEDIFPKDPNQKPMLGPDRHFELYYRLAMEVPCPKPIPHYEGDGTEAAHGAPHAAHADPQPTLAEAVRFAAAGRQDGGAGKFDSLGGANCPPNQWP